MAYESTVDQVCKWKESGRCHSWSILTTPGGESAIKQTQIALTLTDLSSWAWTTSPFPFRCTPGRGRLWTCHQSQSSSVADGLIEQTRTHPRSLSLSLSLSLALSPFTIRNFLLNQIGWPTVASVPVTTACLPPVKLASDDQRYK